MTIHETEIARMQKAGMVNLAAEAIRRALADTEDELAESRKDLDVQRARFEQDELYVLQLEQRLTALRARLAQLESVPAFGVVAYHGDQHQEAP